MNSSTHANGQSHGMGPSRGNAERAIVVRITPRRVAVVALVASLVGLISSSPQDAATVQVPPSDRVTVVPAPRSAPRDASSVATDLFYGGERAQLMPSDESILDVLKRLSPEALSEVEAKMKDPTTRAVILEQLRDKGRRFFGLALLRDRHQTLYEAKIEVILAQQETYTFACQYHEARRNGRAEDVSRAEARLWESAHRAAAADLFAQAQELLALEEHIGQRRIELAHRSEPQYQKESVRKVVEGFMNSAPPCARKVMPAGGSAGN